MTSVRDPIPYIIGCEFERVDGDSTIPADVPSACGACADLYLGGGVVQVSRDGFTRVIAGRCIRFALEAEQPQIVAG